MLALRMKKAVRNGATLVVADPRRIWLTKLAKRHLQLRPGTDVWLLNAMMHVIVAEGLQDEDYIREFTGGLRRRARGRLRYTPEEAERVTGVPGRGRSARPRASTRPSGTRRSSTRSGSPSTRAAVDNIWSLSNLVLMTGHLGYESTGLNALRGQNNVQGLNDAGANPAYLPGYQAVDDPEIRRKFSEAWGVEVPETPGYRLDQMMSGLPRRADQGALPGRREPRADRAERAPRRGRASSLEFLVSQDLFLNETSREHADVVFPASSFAEKDGTFTNTERRVNRVRARGAVPGAGARGLADRRRLRAARSAPAGRSTRRRVGLERVRRPRRPNWYGIRYDRIEEVGLQWPCPDRDHPGIAVPARAAAGAAGRARASSSRSSTSRRSSSPTPSTRSCSRPGARSTTTTRRR